ncbi:hypothetical protein HY031_01145 [Candidatus Gottesmanbacteria bacterium]|nr:hypothetical protein [Candidatus Gottesmanbacteria bacterium]
MTMRQVTKQELDMLRLPVSGSHKGQNGKLLIVGGSHLFHAASLWALEVASRIVDLVHYSSVPENNQIVLEVKKEFRDGIVVPRSDIENYIEEDDVILIGPGMTRDNETEELTNKLLKKYATKKWVIDAGSLQMMDVSLIPKNAILTPHHGEFEVLWKKSALGGSPVDSSRQSPIISSPLSSDAKAVTGLEKTRLPALVDEDRVRLFAKTYHWAGDALYQKTGPFFNASDLAGQIPLSMKELLSR